MDNTFDNKAIADEVREEAGKFADEADNDASLTHEDAKTELSDNDIDKAVDDAQSDGNLVASPGGLSNLTDDAMVVLGLFVKERNRALAVQEVETILKAMQVEIVTDVVDCFTELEGHNLIVECPDEVHTLGETNIYGETFGETGSQSRYRLV